MVRTRVIIVILGVLGFAWESNSMLVCNVWSHVQVLILAVLDMVRASICMVVYSRQKK